MKNIIKAIGFLLLLYVTLCISTDILKFKQDMPTMTEFYKQGKDEIQVVALGSSHTMYAVSPMHMYREHGITSYTFGTGNQMIETSYHVLVEVFKRQNPEIVILDVSNILYDNPEERQEKNRPLLDQMHLSINKMRLSKVLAEKDDNLFFNIISGLAPLYTYHSRWKELDKDELYFWDNDFKTKGQFLGGRVYAAFARKFKDTSVSAGDKVNAKEIPKNNRIYLERIIMLCEEHGTQLLLISTPSIFWSKQKDKAILDLTKAWELDYLNLNMPNGELLDYSRDMYDNNHANVNGAKKITDYLTEYMISHYGIEQKTAVKDYDDALKYYEKQEEILDIQLETNMEAYLSKIMTGDKYSYEICASAGYDENKDSGMYVLLESAGITDVKEAQEEFPVFTFKGQSYVIEKEGVAFLVIDNESGLVIDNVVFYSNDKGKILRKKNQIEKEQLRDYRRWLLGHYKTGGNKVA